MIRYASTCAVPVRRQLPIVMTGLGLLSIAGVCSIAYISSLLTCCDDLHDSSIPNLHRIHDFVNEQMKSSIQQLQQWCSTVKNKPKTWHTERHQWLPKQYSPQLRTVNYAHLQHKLTELYETAQWQLLVNHTASVDCQYIRLQMLQQPYVNQWLTASPHVRAYTLTDEEFRIAIRHRLGLHSRMELHHRICVCTAQFDAQPLHLLHCKHIGQ